jgi:hypothetical protein
MLTKIHKKHIYLFLNLSKILGCYNVGVLWFKNRLVVPKVSGLHQKILDEAHLTRFSIHPGSNKMYHDLK